MTAPRGTGGERCCLPAAGRPSCGGECLTGDVRGYYYLGAGGRQGHFAVVGSGFSGEKSLTGELGLRCSFAHESAGLELRQGAGTKVSCRYMLALAAVALGRAGLKAGGTMYRARTTRRLVPRIPRCLACC